MVHGEGIFVDRTSMHEHLQATFLIGSSTSDQILATMRKRAWRASGPVMVVLQSGHRAEHVGRGLQLYAPPVTVGSFLLAQDGHLDRLPTSQSQRAGPLIVTEEFPPDNPDFEVDFVRGAQFLVTHPTKGWRRRERNRGL
jgi:cephalosporin hydroxylase